MIRVVSIHSAYDDGLAVVGALLSTGRFVWGDAVSHDRERALREAHRMALSRVPLRVKLLERA